ncbi:hypothetical protein GRZ55_11355 [Chelativorans sp. ZYF759]|uniref:hypothetical protein n=1 Tax=Chelativorans sp. ZYF759 TaxID=2692213 RepID=UPI00145DA6FA|nr:hypothetical protein [Chelativorans sp. ZYF759]NMG39841.1 hypothetical protein [Chelativorans sp. ZYF759]
MRRLVLVLALSVAASSAQGGALVGQWCDRPLEAMASLDSVMRIEIRESGPVLVDLFRGSAREVDLRDQGEGVFVEAGGDGYRIAGADLELFDEMGVIRTASRMDDDAAEEECWR